MRTKISFLAFSFFALSTTFMYETTFGIWDLLSPKGSHLKRGLSLHLFVFVFLSLFLFVSFSLYVCDSIISSFRLSFYLSTLFFYETLILSFNLSFFVYVILVSFCFLSPSMFRSSLSTLSFFYLLLLSLSANAS